MNLHHFNESTSQTNYSYSTTAVEAQSARSSVISMTTAVADYSQLAVIRELALRVLYIVIGSFGTVGNLTVIVILMFFASVTQRV